MMDNSDAMFQLIFTLHLHPDLFDDFKRSGKPPSAFSLLEGQDFDGICRSVEAINDRLHHRGISQGELPQNAA